MPIDPLDFTFVGRDEIAFFRGGYRDFLEFLRNRSWRANDSLVIALQPAFHDDGWYLYWSLDFERLTERWLASDPEKQGPSAAADFFGMQADKVASFIESTAGPVAGTSLVLDEVKELLGAFMHRNDHDPHFPREMQMIRGFQPPIQRWSVDHAGTSERWKIIKEYFNGKKASPILRRTPHLRPGATSPLMLGDEFPVVVYADGFPLNRNEEGEDIVINDPEQRPTYSLSVWLAASEHFEVLDSSLATITIRRDEPATDPVTFRVRVRSLEPGAQGALTASFMYEGRPCGRVTRGVQLGSAPMANAEPNGKIRDFSASIQVDTSAKEPDLTVVVACPDEEEDRYQVRVTTPHGNVFQAGAPESWKLGKTAKFFVADHLAQFAAPGARAPQRMAELRSAGTKLFRHSPKVFQQAILALLAAEKLRTLLIVSEEPDIPWELMVPVLPTDEPRFLPLGSLCAVGRWIHKAHFSPPPSLQVLRACVVAPQYPGPRPRPLPCREAECEMLRERFKSVEAEPADFDGMISCVQNGTPQLLHFVCHGCAEPGSTIQKLDLAGGNRFSSTSVEGSPELVAAFRQERPLVFVNACEVGRAAPALSGIGGFAEAFIAIGASAVIAPLWSVDDEIAHEVACSFYGQSFDRPAAETLKGIRAWAYEGERAGVDTYAAYCFYGDPHFILESPDPE